MNDPEVIEQHDLKQKAPWELKPEINNFIWMHAPDRWTLKHAEEVACKIYDLFNEEVEGGGE